MIPQDGFVVFDTAVNGALDDSAVSGDDFELRSPYLGFAIDYTAGDETDVTVFLQVKEEGEDNYYVLQDIASARMDWTFSGTQKSAKCVAGSRDNEPSQFCFGRVVRFRVLASGGGGPYTGTAKIYAYTFAPAAERYH